MSGAKRPFRGERARPATLDRPSTIDVTIERIVGGGDGIGFANGLTVFVPLAAPGDTVRATITRRKGKIVWGTIAEVLEASPRRVEPGCPYFGTCGGCDFQQLGYEDQLSAKQGIIVEALRRIAKLPDVPDVPITPSPDPWRYRSRAEWQIDHTRGTVGYFAAGSHTVVDVETCPISAEPVQTLLTTLRDDVAAGLVPDAATEYRGVTGDIGSVLEPSTAAQSREISRTLLDDTYRFSAACFFQANIPVTAAMVEEVNGIADTAKDAPGIAIDLYSGVGLFTLPLARRFPRIVGVESFRPAAEYAKQNLSAAGLENAHIAAAPVEQWLAGDHSPLGHVALLVFDPPRTGAGADVVAGILRLKPAHIAAVSCDPATFARDLRGLLDGGYRLATLRAFDLFPQTHHVEVVAHLVREAA